MKGTLPAILGVAALVALPVASQMAADAYKDYQMANERFRAFAEYRTEQQRFADRVNAYRAFAQDVNSFMRAAERSGIVPEAWVSYDVKLENRPVDIESFDALVETTRHGEGYYFKPRMLELTTAAGRAQQQDQGPRRRSTGAGTEGVQLSLEGTYLVYDRL